MKVALCLSGQIRNWKKCFDSIEKQILEKYNCDVFIHTWNTIGNPVPHHYDINFKHNLELIDMDILKKYHPKKIKIDFPNYELFKNKIPNSRFYNTLMMWYSVYNSNKLKCEYEYENNLIYDVNIRCRFDTLFENFEINEVKENTIYLPPNENINNPFTDLMKKTLKEIGPSYMPNDQFSYGDLNSMNYYCKVHKILENNIYEYIHHPEGILTEHLWKKNISDTNVEINNNIRIQIQR